MGNEASVPVTQNPIPVVNTSRDEASLKDLAEQIYQSVGYSNVIAEKSLNRMIREVCLTSKLTNTIQFISEHFPLLRNLGCAQKEI
jgi:hypothetical protein